MAPDRRRISLPLFAVLWTLDVAVFLSEKAAVGASTFDAPVAFYVRLLHQPWWWLGLALGPLQLVVWTAILRRTALSVAYPLSGASCLLTMVAARCVFGEQLGWSVWLGAACMMVGVAMVGGASSQGTTAEVAPLEPGRCAEPASGAAERGS